MVSKGKAEVVNEQISYVSAESVWTDAIRNQRMVLGDEVGSLLSMVALPCSVNPFLCYAVGENLESIFNFCRSMFTRRYSSKQNPMVQICFIPTGEAVSIRFVVDVLPTMEELSSSEEDIDTPSFEEGFSDDEEWNEEPEDYDY